MIGPYLESGHNEEYQGIPFAIKTILIWNHDCSDCHREWNSERAVEMCRDFVFVRFHLLAFHFNEFRTCRTQPSSISRQTVEGSLGFGQTIKTSKVDRWFGSIGNQDCNRTKGMSLTAMKPHFGCNPDCFDYERNAMCITSLTFGSIDGNWQLIPFWKGLGKYFQFRHQT